MLATRRLQRGRRQVKFHLLGVVVLFGNVLLDVSDSVTYGSDLL